MRLVLLLLVLLWAGGAGAAERLHNFYGERPQVATQAEFVQTLRASLKSVPRQGLVRLFNEQYGQTLGQVQGLDELLDKLGGSDFEVRPCTGTVEAYGFTDAGAFGTIRRACYRDERVLVHRASGVPVMSLFCGNLLKAPPASECMELWVKPVGGVPQEALLRLWGANTTPACGLKPVSCVDCVDPVLGRVAATFHAPIVGEKVLLPRAMVAQMLKLCVGITGYTADGRMPDRAVQGSLAAAARDNAEQLRLTVLGVTQWLEFGRM